MTQAESDLRYGAPASPANGITYQKSNDLYGNVTLTPIYDINPDAATFIANVIAAGGTMSTAKQAAYTTYLNSLYSYQTAGVRLYNKFISFGTFEGGDNNNLAAALIKIKAGSGTPQSFVNNGPFVSGDVSSLGLSSSTGNKYLEVIPSTIAFGITGVNVTMMVAMMDDTNIMTSQGFIMGENVASGQPKFYIGGDWITANSQSSAGGIDMFKSITSGNGTDFYQDGDLFVTRHTVAYTGTSLSDTPITLFKTNRAGASYYGRGKVGLHLLAPALSIDERTFIVKATAKLFIAIGRLSASDLEISAFFGDSIVAGWLSSGVSSSSAGTVTARFTRQVANSYELKEKNYGVPGHKMVGTDLTYDSLYGKYKRLLETSQIYNIRKIVIMIGVNDLQQLSVSVESDLTTFKADYIAMIEYFKKFVPVTDIIIGSQEYFNNGATNSTELTVMRSVIKKIAIRTGVKYADVYQAMVDYKTNTGGGLDSSILSGDNLHPIDIGHTTIANALLLAAPVYS